MGTKRSKFLLKNNKWEERLFECLFICMVDISSLSFSLLFLFVGFFVRFNKQMLSLYSMYTFPFESNPNFIQSSFVCCCCGLKWYHGWWMIVFVWNGLISFIFFPSSKINSFISTKSIKTQKSLFIFHIPLQYSKNLSKC